MTHAQAMMIFNQDSGHHSSKHEGRATKLHDVLLIKDSELGTGATGAVVRAWWQGAMVAVKRVRLAYMKVEGSEKIVNSMMDRLRKEAKLLCELRHPHIVQFFGLTPDDSLVMELMDLSLSSRLHGEKKSAHAQLGTQQQVEIMHGASAGVQYLHSRDILHRDLSANNILLQEMSGGRLLAKVTDYGTAVHFDADHALTHMTNTHGSLPYLAPEVIESSNSQGGLNAGETTKSDVWSLGILAMEVALARKPPLVVLQKLRDKNLAELADENHVFCLFLPDCFERQAQMRPEAQEVNLQLRDLLEQDFRDSVRESLKAKRLQRASSAPPEGEVEPQHETRAEPCTDTENVDRGT